VVDRFEHLDHIFSVISELDPHYLDPYEIGAMIAVYEARDMDLAFKILDKGLEKNRDQWIFPFQAGHYAQMMTKDYKRAREYYKKTMAIKGAPDITKRLYANAAFKLADYQTAWETWREVFENTEDERIKKIAGSHLYQVRSAMDIEALREAIEEYRQSYGHNPASLSQLVSTGILSKLPQDLDGKDYLYDPQSGEIKAPSNPWKR
jgi:tetratricopeptide (TPR) repeat protein